MELHKTTTKIGILGIFGVPQNLEYPYLSSVSVLDFSKSQAAFRKKPST
jgi:hypothetical protein